MLSRISDALPALSRAEQKVGQWILKHPKEALSANLAQLARDCGTSQPTVVRFCRHVGLGGFRELGLRLAESMSTPGSHLHRDVDLDDSISDAATKVVDASIQSLVDLRAQLSQMPIEAAATAMQSARQIAFAGLGASGQVACDARHKFFRLGIPCSTLLDSPTILQFAAISGPRDVLLLLSHSGRWPEITQAARVARERGATVIAMTCPDSSLADLATLLFPCRVSEDTNLFTPMSSRLAHLALLDSILVALALRQGDAAAERLRLCKDVLRPTTANLPQADETPPAR
tara:strand:- start:784 stop:1650 length:867 start_codon:yes stop_codon:yes gene_type:complete